jgi:hypothetical protein
MSFLDEFATRSAVLCAPEARISWAALRTTTLAGSEMLKPVHNPPQPSPKALQL